MAFKLPLRIFKTPRHQRFEYKPRYWDPDREEKEKRLAHIKMIQEKDNVEGMKARISSGLRKGGSRNEAYRSKLVKQSNYRVLFVLLGIIVLAILVLWIFLPELVSAFLKPS